MKHIKRKWGLVLLMVVILTLAFATPVFAEDGVPPTAEDERHHVRTISLDDLGGFLVFFMQAGFALVETGFTRNHECRAHHIMNMMVFCIGASDTG